MAQLPPVPVEPESLVVVALPVKHRPGLEEGPFLQSVPHTKCRHWKGPFEIDSDAGKCRCKTCGEEVDPMFVLKRLMQQESQWMATRAAYQDQMKRLAERSSTKCQHCGQMTRISHR